MKDDTACYQPMTTVQLAIHAVADVYLMAARRSMNWMPAAAAPYLKPILDRALPAAKVNAYMAQATASKAAFFNAIVEQRALDCGESLRKAD
jgi:hypothetical protein